jgi:uncharacterized protein YdeI (BOF family)
MITLLDSQKAKNMIERLQVTSHGYLVMQLGKDKY